jgi:hypothetical protein
MESGNLIRAYITGIYLYNLPIEEVLFFFIVPYCCVFIICLYQGIFSAVESFEKGEADIFVVWPFYY